MLVRDVFFIFVVVGNVEVESRIACLVMKHVELSEQGSHEHHIKRSQGSIFINGCQYFLQLCLKHVNEFVVLPRRLFRGNSVHLAK